MTQEVKLRRAQANYQSENARFLLECDFSKQYHRYYRKRLERTRPYLEVNCRSKWNPNIPIYSLAELACFSVDCPDNEAFDENDDTPKSPDQLVSSLSPECLSGNYKFAKRIRHNSARPQTSTQKQDDEHPDECIVIGTIVKRMKLQPDVVEELSRGDFHVNCERYLGHYTNPDDTLVLEDADESISLIGNISPKRFVTGIVVALLGISIDDGSQFVVRDICFAEPNRQILYDDVPEWPLDINRQEPIYLLVVSGLGFHHEMDKENRLTKALQNLIDFIWGGAKYADDERNLRVARILVAGNCLSEDRLKTDDTDTVDPDQDEVVVKMRQSRQVKPYKGTIQAVNHMDDFFAQLSKTIDVDVMPGQTDPTSHLMPQQPFHPCMFPKSCLFSTFNCITNPHHAIYNDNVEILATSGQNVDIISKFSNIHDPIDVMKCHLMWGNCAPSAPDNLYSVPYENDDPFVIDFIPEIYIAGCQKNFATDYYHYDSSSSTSQSHRFAGESGTTNQPASTSQISPTNNGESSSRTTHPSVSRKDRTLLVTVPQFCETYSCVLVNLKSLEAELIEF